MSWKLVLARFVPEGEFDPIPQPKFVVDNAQIVFHDMLSRAEDFCDFTVFESLSDEHNYSPLSLVRNTFSVALPLQHGDLPQFKPSLHILTAKGLLFRSEKINIS
jgi:hypothetical protein